MSALMVAFFLAIVIVGGIILLLISSGLHTGKQLNVQKYRSRWMAIDRQLVKEQSASYQLAILNADKLLDQALRDSGIKGDTMGERMKAAKDKWSSANNVWSAHKLRNQIAHEDDFQVAYDTTRRAMSSFKQALKDLGAI